MKKCHTNKPVRRLTASNLEELYEKIKKLPSQPSVAGGCELIQLTVRGQVQVYCSGVCTGEKNCTTALTVSSPQDQLIRGKQIYPPIMLQCTCQ